MPSAHAYAQECPGASAHYTPLPHEEPQSCLAWAPGPCEGPVTWMAKRARGHSDLTALRLKWPAEAPLLPCHHHCQHWSPGRGQPDPGLYRCKMGSNTEPDGVGWGGEGCVSPRTQRAPRGPYSVWQQRMWGCRQGIILRGSLRERKEAGKRRRKEERRGLCPETVLRHQGWELREQEGAGGLGVEVLGVFLEGGVLPWETP